MTWQRQESASRCDSCRAYWNTLQDLGEEWDAAGRPEGPNQWGVLIARGLTAYSEHLVSHLPQEQQ
jgi:hypothetical protein